MLNDESKGRLISGYNVHRASDREQMFKAIGISSIEDLFRSIPQAIRLKRPLDLPQPHNEWELRKHIERFARKNVTVKACLSLLGGGAYEHHIPAVVDAICTRGEFLTAYTPYQPEMSQGLLQVLFEYQKLIAALTGLPLVNCSLYDGATAMAEAAWMACAITQVKRIVAADTIWPQYRQVLDTYMKGRGVEVATVRYNEAVGQVDGDSMAQAAATPAAAVIIQSPNAFGIVEDIAAASAVCRRHGALLNVSCYPMALGILKSPGELGANIVTCEGQPLGIPLGAGGPYLGILATERKHEKFIPGRLVGRLTDLCGKIAYALVKEDREQHVSREKATSHICSNQALQALRAAVYLACVGEQGFKDIACQNAGKAHYLCDKLCSILGVRRVFSGPFFNEFALAFPCPVTKLLDALDAHGIWGGLNISGGRAGLENTLLVAVTELRSKAELDHVAAVFGQTIRELCDEPANTREPTRLSTTSLGPSLHENYL